MRVRHILLVTAVTAWGCNKTPADAAATAASAAAKPADPAVAGETPVVSGAPGVTPGANPVTPVASGVMVTGPERWIPAAAGTLLHIDLQRFMASSLWQANVVGLEGDAEFVAQRAAMAACNVPLTSLRSLDLGVGPDGGALALVLQAPGIGKADNLRCLHKAIDKDGAWRLEDTPLGLRLSDKDGEVFGQGVGEDSLVMATAEWDKAVQALIAGGGDSVRQGDLKTVLTGVDQSQAIWFAMNVPPELSMIASGMVAPGLAGLRSVTGAFDFGAGVGASLALQMGDPSAVKPLFTELQQQFDTFKPMASALGLPAGAVDKIQLGVQDSAITISLNWSEAEASAMWKLLSVGVTVQNEDGDDPAADANAPE